MQWITCLFEWLVMMAIVHVGWLIFRSSSIEQFLFMLSHISLTPSPQSAGLFRQIWPYWIPLILVQAHQFFHRDLLSIPKVRLFIRVPCYSLMLAAILYFLGRDAVEFVYFQF